MKRQQAHVVSSNKNIIYAHLTGRLHLSKFYSPRSLTTPFVKILHRQTFAPYGISLRVSSSSPIHPLVAYSISDSCQVTMGPCTVYHWYDNILTYHKFLNCCCRCLHKMIQYSSLHNTPSGLRGSSRIQYFILFCPDPTQKKNSGMATRDHHVSVLVSIALFSVYHGKYTRSLI